MNNYNAYHFFGDTLRNDIAVPANGVTLKHTGPVKICWSGLHASYDPFDALKYAPGNNLARVYCTDVVTEHNDKFVCRERTIVQRIDATDLLRKFARLCALDVIDKWDAPQVVIDWLKTGDEQYRKDAYSAARSAANYAANYAAYYATKSSYSSAYSAAYSSAYSAAYSSAYSAAYSAARSAAYSSAYSAADSYYADKKKQRERFNRLVNEAFDKLGKK